MKLRYAALSLALSAFLIAPSARGVTLNCPPDLNMGLYDQGKQVILHDVGAATARVWVGDRHVGTATVVSLDPILLLTANHLFEVSDGRMPLVEFPAVDPGQRYEARIVTTSRAGTRALSETGDDVAVLGMSGLPFGVRGIDISTRAIERGDYGYAFGTGAGRPEQGLFAEVNGTMSCRSFHDAATTGGDSGGAFASRKGLVSGVVIHRDGKGGRYSPLACVLPSIIEAARIRIGETKVARRYTGDDLLQPSAAAALGARENHLSLALDDRGHVLRPGKVANLDLELMVDAFTQDDTGPFRVTASEYCYLEDAVHRRLGKKSARTFFVNVTERMKLVPEMNVSGVKTIRPDPVIQPPQTLPSFDVVPIPDSDPDLIRPGYYVPVPGTLQPDMGTIPLSPVPGAVRGAPGHQGPEDVVLTAPANVPPPPFLPVSVEMADPSDPLLDPQVSAWEQHVRGKRLFEAYRRLYERGTIDANEWAEEMRVAIVHLERAEEEYALDAPFDPARVQNLRLLDGTYHAKLTLAIERGDERMEDAVLLRRREILAAAGPGLFQQLGIGASYDDAAVYVRDSRAPAAEQATALIAAQNRDLILNIIELFGTDPVTAGNVSTVPVDRPGFAPGEATMGLAPGIVAASEPFPSLPVSPATALAISPIAPASGMTIVDDATIASDTMVRSFERSEDATRFLGWRQDQGDPVYLREVPVEDGRSFQVMRSMAPPAPTSLGVN